MSAMIERIADAIEGAEVEYHLRLTSLIDGVSTYSLDYGDGAEPLSFDCTDDAYAHIAQKKRLKAAHAALTVLREPTDEMIVAGDDRILAHLGSRELLAAVPTPAQNCFVAMIDEALSFSQAQSPGSIETGQRGSGDVFQKPSG